MIVLSRRTCPGKTAFGKVSSSVQKVNAAGSGFIAYFFKIFKIFFDFFQNPGFFTAGGNCAMMNNANFKERKAAVKRKTAAAESKENNQIFGGEHEVEEIYPDHHHGGRGFDQQHAG
ncbi:MAG: hypothetical protein Q4F29_07940 [Lachnospiraceae bacterium]|nr:hypothetical protein [Lachnospiraceae bacterium]